MSNRYSTIFESKLPSFIRDDPTYSRFIQFFDAYYEWFDDTYDIYGFGDKLDIDSGFEQFYSYYAADFLPYFPDIDTIAADKIKLIKIVKELYKAKGIPDSFKFLFRALYNTHVETYPTGQFVLKPSDGKWIVPRSIKIKSNDPVFLNINNFKVLGEISKSIGVIETSKINGRFIQIYLSNIERVFNSAETIRIIDYHNKDVYFLNGEYVQYDTVPPIGAVLLTSKIIGSISGININPARRGKYYKVGDPAVIIGGFAPFSDNPIGATGYVSEVTTGQIQNVVITNSGYGYRSFPNSGIDIIRANGSFDTVANCIVSLVDESKPAMISYISNDCIIDNLPIALDAEHYNFAANLTANLTTTLANCFSFAAFSTFPVTAVTVRNGGGGYDSPPSLQIHSSFNANTVDAYPQDIEQLGILAPIQIVNGGIGYTINDTITISGGLGSLAFARINTVNTAGTITNVEYYYNSAHGYSVGGMGYSNDGLPTVNVNSTTGSSANLVIPGVLGTGVEYILETDRIGAITKLNLLETGEDYVSVPEISLRVQDIAITGTTVESINPDTCIVYQGNDYITATFIGSINSVTSLYFNSETNYQLFSVRIYNYKGVIDPTINLYVRDTEKQLIVSTLTLQTDYNTTRYKNGILIYGDGSAKANAKFLNGLIQDDGRYLNTDGQPSAHSVLQDDVYNSSTYILAAEKDYDSYKNTIANLLHPIGTRIITKNLLKSNASLNISTSSLLNIANSYTDMTAVLTLENNQVFSNTVTIICDFDIDERFGINDIVSVSGNNFNICSTITNVNVSTGVIKLKDFVRYKFANVYNGYTNSNTIIITDNNYTEQEYSILSLVGIGDVIVIENNTSTLINIMANTLYFTNALTPSGSITNTKKISVIKNLTSNNITVYSTV